MSNQESKSPSVPVTTAAIASETMERLTQEAKHKQHPYGMVWQRFDTDAFAELASNIKSRGLDQDILLYQDMVLEGWHRYLACLLTKTEPRFIQFEGTDLQAAEKVHASGVRRQSSADQRYAAFLSLGIACPEFKAKYEALKQKGVEQKSAGTPLSTDNQRVDVLGEKAKAAGVSKSTAVKVEQVQKLNPQAVEEIAKGKTTANKELKKIKGATPPTQKKPKSPPPPPKNIPHKNSGPSPHSEETRQVVVKVTDKWVAQMNEFFEEFGIKPKSQRKDEFTVFEFQGTATDEDNVLTSIGDLLKANGPVPLEIKLG